MAIHVTKPPISRQPTDVHAFEASFEALFHGNHGRLTRLFDRLSGDADLASDLVQEAFVRLHRRGALPDSPEAWLVTVALNLLRNARTTARRHERLLQLSQHAGERTDPAPRGDELVQIDEARHRVRLAVDQLPERERQLLMLRAEGYSYREMAIALDINEASIGTLLARAKEAFRHLYEDESDAP